jgi:hypothetical protein
MRGNPVLTEEEPRACEETPYSTRTSCEHVRKPRTQRGRATNTRGNPVLIEETSRTRWGTLPQRSARSPGARPDRRQRARASPPPRRRGWPLPLFAPAWISLTGHDFDLSEAGQPYPRRANLIFPLDNLDLPRITLTCRRQPCPGARQACFAADKLVGLPANVGALRISFTRHG